MFTAPTAFRAIRKEDPKGALSAGYDLSGLRYLFLAGERLDPKTYHWASALLGVPVVDHWWQTETGWPIVANPMGIEAAPLKPGSPTRPLPGWNVRVLDPSGKPAPAGIDGAIAVKLPCHPERSPPSGTTTTATSPPTSPPTPATLTGDSGHIDDDSYIFIMGRTDDVINVAGHRLSTGSMEEALAAHPDIAECAVTGVADALKGQVPRGLVVLPASAANRARSRPNSSSSYANASAPSPPSRTSRSSPHCPTPARERTCARRCATSPTATTNPSPPPWTTPASSTPCAPFSTAPVAPHERRLTA
ncbi:AMP-binding protein [Streptomyces sp. NBC_01361]